MDNNNFAQQFTQDIKSNAHSVEQNPQPNRGILIAMAVIVVLVIMQLIVSIVTLTKLSSSAVDYEDEGAPDTTYGEPDNSANSVYDDDDYLIALNATCKSDKNGSIVLTKDNTYQKLDNDSTTTSTGTYSITNGSVFNFADAKSEKTTLFYDGFSLTDGTTFYNCETSTTTESSSEE